MRANKISSSCVLPKWVKSNERREKEEEVRKSEKMFFTKADFPAFFLLFMASVWSRPPGPHLVPGVFDIKSKHRAKIIYRTISNSV